MLYVCSVICELYKLELSITNKRAALITSILIALNNHNYIFIQRKSTILYKTVFFLDTFMCIETIIQKSI